MEPETSINSVNPSLSSLESEEGKNGIAAPRCFESVEEIVPAGDHERLTQRAIQLLEELRACKPSEGHDESMIHDLTEAIANLVERNEANGKSASIKKLNELINADQEPHTGPNFRSPSDIMFGINGSATEQLRLPSTTRCASVLNRSMGSLATASTDVCKTVHESENKNSDPKEDAISQKIRELMDQGSVWMHNESDVSSGSTAEARDLQQIWHDVPLNDALKLTAKIDPFDPVGHDAAVRDYCAWVAKNYNNFTTLGTVLGNLALTRSINYLMIEPVLQNRKIDIRNMRTRDLTRQYGREVYHYLRIDPAQEARKLRAGRNGITSKQQVFQRVVEHHFCRYQRKTPGD